MTITASRMITYFIITFALHFPFLVSAHVDMTRVPRTSGNDVVEAVVDRIRGSCIFPNDRLFLRRVAFVESTDGKDTRTYRNNYHGGIWQVDEDMFDATKTITALSSLKPTIDGIQSNFSITWSTVWWQDLEKPLYSGLAAVLYLRLKYQQIPGLLNDQAYLWQSYYRKNGNLNDFVSKVSSLDEVSCESKPVDIVFVVDESGSIGLNNFEKMKTFLADIVNQITISSTAFQVGLVKFDGSATVEFNLKQYHDIQSIKNAIHGMSYSGGGTDISLGIDTARMQVFRTSSRKEATKVILLLTDGESNLRSTQMASDIARNESIVIFALGIGGINQNELNAAGNDPDCTHVLIINGFNEIKSILYEIKKSACTVAKPIDIVQNIGSSVQGELSSNKSVVDTVEITPGNDNVTSIVTEVKCGNVTIYASPDTMRPNEAFYTEKGFATDGHPSIMMIDNDGRKLYVAYTAYQAAHCTLGSFDIRITPGPPKVADVICMKDGHVQNCTEVDFIASKYKDLMCLKSHEWTDINNPCTTGRIDTTYSHPRDTSKFIRCTNGMMHVTQCPPGTIYSEKNRGCLGIAATTESSISNQHVTNVVNNPCTSPDKLYYPHPFNSNKFIHCNLIGQMFILPCPANLVWNDAKTTCDYSVY